MNQKNQTKKNENTAIREAKERLFYQPKQAWEEIADKAEIFSYADGYRSFLDDCKTEREAVAYAVNAAEKAGYQPYHFGEKAELGKKYYYNNRGKSVFLFDIGTDVSEVGIRMTAAHVDAPRLDLKQRPIYADNGLGYFKTHYYGGIKKYQWATIPLALHGHIVRADGSELDVRLGEDDTDPVFYISDLLPHLGKEQMAKTLADGITAEQLNLIACGTSFPDSDGNDGVKLALLSLLNEKYSVTEKDLVSAELCAVPAQKARYVGLDRSMIAAYGHDDRVCAYPALTALLHTPSTKGARMAVLADKEEIGSVGNTGMRSAVLSDLMAVIAEARGLSPAQVRAESVCLSADVTAGFDPTFSDVYDKRNAAYLGQGIALCKFTGARGKSGASDASAELVGRLCRLFDRNGVTWQMTEMGKVDQGGGGTVAAYFADLNIDVLDMGVPLLSMHAPYELASAADIYMTYRAFSVFYA